MWPGEFRRRKYTSGGSSSYGYPGRLSGYGGSSSRPHAHLGRTILYTTTTTQRGWCIEAFVSILAHLQSLKLLPGGGGV